MKKLLVANRGEIAVRVIKTARAMGIKAVAVYSDADRTAPHVRIADEAIYLGPSPSSESYLKEDALIHAALSTGAEAIHPGYGFLSENAGFAERVGKEGLIFVGPSPYSIRIMGSKLAAKEAVKSYDIPLVPGTDEAVEDPVRATEIADQLGYPILVKASAGGGGKGMRVVHSKEELPEQMRRATSEAASAFGDGAVFIEKYIASPRHIEVQVLADRYGHCIHLFERECSIQRRHQKVIEEAPSTALTGEQREAIGTTAIQVAKACKYEGAGTVEFLLDESGNYYFLEMNTRLQVEHPITEMITGIDLVKHQIEIAQGMPLQLTQDSIRVQGHAIELRVYAEDPANEFLPSVGQLVRYRPPSGPGIRVDDGYREEMEVPIYYDPLLAKLIAYGKTRTEAISIMKKAIDQFHVEGIATTLPFGALVMDNKHFLNGDYDTHFVDKHFDPEELQALDRNKEFLAARLGLYFYRLEKEKLRIHANGASKWNVRRTYD